MARGRMISKSLSTSEKFAALTDSAGALAEFCQALYPLIVSHTDDFGRLQGDTFTVKHMCFPASPRTLSEFDRGLSHLHLIGLIAWYSVGGKKYLQVQQFEQHQQGLHKRTESKFPDIPGSSEKFTVARARGTELKRTELKGTEGKGTKDKSSGETPPNLLKSLPTPEAIEKNVRIITKIAHEVLARRNGHGSGPDACEDVKELCAKRHIRYDSEIVRKALDSAEFQRKRAAQ